MKKYLVAYYVGAGIIQTYMVETEQCYTPLQDNMGTIKEIIIKKASPNWHYSYSAQSNCGGYISISKGDKIKVDDLNIISISRLDL